MLTLYDTALRLSQFRSLLPESVYLHAGAREGAGHLKNYITLDFSKKRCLARSHFPPELHVFEPWEIEDFLCVCKEQLRKLFP